MTRYTTNMTEKTGQDSRPVAVVGFGGTLTAGLLRRLTGLPVVELTPCQAAMAGRDWRAVVVENFDLPEKEGLSGCAVARFELSRHTPVTVVGLDDPEGRRLAQTLPGAVFAYSDGRPQADLTAKNVRLRDAGLEFEALTDRDLLRVRVPCGAKPRLYDHLAALAGAMAVGVPLTEAVTRLKA